MPEQVGQSVSAARAGAGGEIVDVAQHLVQPLIEQVLARLGSTPSSAPPARSRPDWALR